MVSWEIIASCAGCALFLYFIAYGKLEPGRSWIDEELETLGSLHPNPRRGKAVICGGGIAGVLAARTCLSHFEEVILVDPEFRKTLSGKSKSRVMQYWSTHVYLILFAQGLRHLWATFDKRAQEAGRVIFDGDSSIHINGKPFASPLDGQPQSFGMRRATFEPLLHRLLIDETPGAKDRLNVIEGTVTGLKPCQSGPDIRIVSVAGKSVDGVDFELEDVDLVIDCTGRAQCGTRWLADGRFAPPPRVTYSPHLFYTTVTFMVSEELNSRLPMSEKYRNGCVSFLPDADVSHRGLSMVRTDNGTIQICFYSWGPGAFPKEPEEIIPTITSFGFTDPLPDFFLESVRLLVNEGSPVFASTRLATCSWVQYHEAEHCLTNFIALGDATMALNPIYGQGCSKVMLGILLLDRMLREEKHRELLSPTFARQFFRELKGRTQGMWFLTKYGDYKHPTTEPSSGETLQAGKFMRWANKVISQAAETDIEISRILARVRHVLAPESEVMRPGVVLRILWAHVRRSLVAKPLK